MDSRLRGNEREMDLRRFGAGSGRLANRAANKFGAAAAAGINGVFHFGRYRAAAVIGHPSCADRAGHHQRGQTRGGHSLLMAHPRSPVSEDDKFVNYWPVWFQSQGELCNAHQRVAMR